MSAERPAKQVLTDDQLRDILFWRADESPKVLAREFGVSTGPIYSIRKLEGYRALRIAAEFGLVKRAGPRLAFAPHSQKTRKVRSGQIAVV